MNALLPVVNYLAERFLKAHPEGAFPAGIKRMPEDTSLLDASEASSAS
jgi:hypothetical protein